MTKDEALKIENSDFNKYTKQELFEYIIVLREALAQPAQEPVTCLDKMQSITEQEYYEGS